MEFQVVLNYECSNFLFIFFYYKKLYPTSFAQKPLLGVDCNYYLMQSLWLPWRTSTKEKSKKIESARVRGAYGCLGYNHSPM